MFYPSRIKPKFKATIGRPNMEVSTIGIDLAKNIMHIHGVNNNGKTVLKKKLPRDKLLEFMANNPKCLVGMEACGGSNHWAREISKLGHNVKLMAPQFVKPYVKTNKNDRNDAEAICEAVSRPNMRFVPIKTVDQQSTLWGKLRSPPKVYDLEFYSANLKLLAFIAA